jgi:Na+-translocating ferredoxin:NAD+ oxidoreductase RnfA subunit
MHWVTSTDHMALAGMIISSATVIAGFSIRRKRKAGIPPPYSGEMAALITVGIVGIALVVFGP